MAACATVPVINLETITHPCQELAHALMLREQLGETRGRKYVLTWTYHPRPLNTAVANSALLIATRLGFEVTLLCPNPEYVLDSRYLAMARDNAAESGGSLTVSHDIEPSYRDADVVYAKSWGALPYFGDWARELPLREGFRHFLVDEAKMALTRNALFSHCLPLRRNVKATDGGQVRLASPDAALGPELLSLVDAGLSSGSRIDLARRLVVRRTRTTRSLGFRRIRLDARRVERVGSDRPGDDLRDTRVVLRASEKAMRSNDAKENKKCCEQLPKR